MEVLLCVFPSLIHGVWSREDHEERKVSILTVAGIIVVHRESHSLQSDGSAHDWLESSGVVVERVDLEAWADLCVGGNLSKAKWFVKMNCGSTAGEG